VITGERRKIPHLKQHSTEVAGLNDHTIVKYGKVSKTLELKAGKTYRFDGKLQ